MARQVKFFDEQVVVDQEEMKELEALSIQARACIPGSSLHQWIPEQLLNNSGSNKGSMSPPAAAAEVEGGSSSSNEWARTPGLFLSAGTEVGRDDDVIDPWAEEDWMAEDCVYDWEDKELFTDAAADDT